MVAQQRAVISVVPEDERASVLGKNNGQDHVFCLFAGSIKHCLVTKSAVNGHVAGKDLFMLGTM